MGLKIQIPNEASMEPSAAKWRNFLVLVVILILAMAVRIVFFGGLFAIDDFNYLRHAAEVWKGRFEIDNVMYWHGMRLFVFVPISWMFALFGVSEVTAVAWPFVASLCTIILIYRIGRTLHSREAGFYAAFIAAFLPMMVDESTRVVPGALINLIIAFSAFCFIRAETTERKRRLWLLLSGVAFALMPWAGHLGLVFVCFFPLAVLLYGRRRILRYWPLVAGIFVTLLASTLYQWLETGDPFVGISIGRKILATEVPPFRPFFYLRLLVRPLYSQGGIAYLACVGIAAAALIRKRELLLVSTWFLATLLLIEFGSSSLSEYKPLFKQARYLSVIAVPGALLAGMGLVHMRMLFIKVKLVARLSAGGVLVSVLVLVLVVASSLLGLDRDGRWKVQRRAHMLSVMDHVRRWEGSTIYVTHWLWNTRVGFFMRYTDDYFPSGYDPYHAVNLGTADESSKNRYVQTLSPVEEMAPGLLLHDERLFELSRGERKTGLVGPDEIPEVLADPPDTWRLVDRIELGQFSRLALYEIAGGNWPAND